MKTLLVLKLGKIWAWSMAASGRAGGEPNSLWQEGLLRLEGGGYRVLLFFLLVLGRRQGLHTLG